MQLCESRAERLESMRTAVSPLFLPWHYLRLLIFGEGSTFGGYTSVRITSRICDVTDLLTLVFTLIFTWIVSERRPYIPISIVRLIPHVFP